MLWIPCWYALILETRECIRFSFWHSFSFWLCFQLYKSENVSQLPETILVFPTWMHGWPPPPPPPPIKKERKKSCSYTMIKQKWFRLLQRRFSALTVPQSIKLKGSDIRLANTVRNLCASLDPTISFQQHFSSVGRICYLKLRRISAIRHYLSEDVTNVVCVCSFKTVLLQLAFGGLS